MKTIKTGCAVVWRNMQMRGTVRSICLDTMTVDVVDSWGVPWTVCVEDLQPAP